MLKGGDNDAKLQFRLKLGMRKNVLKRSLGMSSKASQHFARSTVFAAYGEFQKCLFISLWGFLRLPVY
jgi:hypothetical protein